MELVFFYVYFPDLASRMCTVIKSIMLYKKCVCNTFQCKFNHKIDGSGLPKGEMEKTQSCKYE